MDTDAAIRVTGLRKTYEDTVAAEGLDLEVDAGGRVGVPAEVDDPGHAVGVPAGLLHGPCRS
jgi:hypothetical protein